MQKVTIWIHPSSQPSTRWLGFGRIGTFFVAIVACFAAYKLAVWSATPKQNSQLTIPEAPLLVDAKSLFFGNVLEHSVFPWSISVQNITSCQLEIVDVLTSCECLKATPKTFLLAPNESQTIELEFDLTPKTEFERKVEGRRKFQTGLQVVVKKGQELIRQEIVLEGTVQNVLSIDPTHLNLGAYSEYSQPLSFSIPIESTIKIKQIDCQIDMKDSLWQGTVTSNQTKLEFGTRSLLDIGSFKIPVVLTIQTDCGTTTKKLEFVGEVVLDLEIIPSVVAFTPDEVGRVKEETVQIRSISGRKIKIRSVSVGDKEAMISPTNTEFLTNVQLVIRQKVQQPGKQSIVHKFRIVDERNNEVEKSLTCWAYGNSIR